MTMNKKAGLPALVLLAVFGMAGCWFDLGEPRQEGQETQPAGGVFTVKGVENGSHYEAELYDYSDNAVADAADLAGIMSQFELAAVGLGTAGNKTLALGLVTLDGENFTADGDFLVVIKKVTKDDSAPLRYKAAVPFIGGSATLMYSRTKTATVEPGDPSVPVYTVTFDLNYTGAPNPPKPQKINEGGKITLPSPAPTREGYTFDGWYTATDYATKWDFDTHTVTTDIGLYAKWLDDSITYRTVTFHTNGGTPADFTQTAEDGGKVTQPAAPVRTGHTFDGWYTPDYAAKWDFDTRTVTTDLDLYAKWTRNTYKVTFDTGDAAHTPAPLDVLYEGTITAPAITKTGHTLDGWYTSTAYTTKWDFALNAVKESITLYGTWMPITYTVTFSLNYTGAPAPPVSPPIAYGGKITEPSAPQRTGCTIDGWYKDAAKTTKWNFGTDTVTENITLYAKWAVWTLSKDTGWTVTNGSAVSIVSERPIESEYTSYTDETHYTYKKRYQLGTTIYEIETSRNGESAHEVDIRRYDNGVVTTTVTDRVYDADSGLLKQETNSESETLWTIIPQNTAADGTKTYKYFYADDAYSIYTIKDGVTLSDVYYYNGSLLYTKTYTFPDNPVIRERLPALTLTSVAQATTPSGSRYETCELLASSDTTLTVRIKTFYTSTNVLSKQYDCTYTKVTLP